MRYISFIFLILTGCLLFSACQKEGVLIEKPTAKALTVTYYTVGPGKVLRVKVNGKLIADSLTSGNPALQPVAGEELRLEILERASGKVLRDTLISAPGNKPLTVALLQLSSDADAAPELLMGTPIENEKKINWAIYIDNSSGAFPGKVDMVVVRANTDINGMPLGTIDTLARMDGQQPGRLSNMVQLDLSDDISLWQGGMPGAYFLLLYDSSTGAVIPGTEFDPLSFSGVFLQYFNYDPVIKNYVSILSADASVNPAYFSNMVAVQY